MMNWQRIWNDDGSGSRYSPAKIITYALSLPYRLIINFRNRLYDYNIFREVKLSCPVISVGNITVGGTGKTPCVIWLAQMLQERGYKPAVLSRGYGSKSSRPVNIVSDGKDILLAADQAGDEPLLIARSLPGVPVITGPQRISTGKIAIDKYGADILICDDAFQHRRIFRDINLVLLDSQRPLGNSHVLPRGSLREPATELRRADAFILTRSDDSTKTNVFAGKPFPIPDIPVFRSTHMSIDIVRGDYSARLPLAALKDKKVCAFAGIARPDSFRKLILAAGAQIVAFADFPDHYCYNQSELDKIRRDFLASGADFLISTEKDGMRLQKFGELLSTIYLLRIALKVIADEKLLEEFILEKLGKNS
jgi:tetraacyldisaccharide 4'-kinase